LKRSKLIKELQAQGCLLKRHGGRHDVYWNPANGKMAPIPRHSEVKDTLCALIRKQLDI